LKVLVTGGAGRLGAEVCRVLSETGAAVKAFDLPSVSFAAVEGLRGVEAVKGSITEASDVSEACGDVDAVIHLAALLPPRSEANREATMRVNVEGTRRITEAVERRETLLVFASSIATYGVTAGEKTLIREDHPQAATDTYSESKIAAERLVRAAKAPWITLRIAPVAVADLVEPSDPVPFREDQRVEFVYIEDAAKAAIACLGDKGVLGKTLNVAGGATWRVTGGEYMRGLYSALGVEVDLNYSGGYTAVDWYDTSAGSRLGYQRTTLPAFHEKLKKVGESLGLR
jgi:nucleoside-diphosphate-sugar epimerase